MEHFNLPETFLFSNFLLQQNFVNISMFPQNCNLDEQGAHLGKARIAIQGAAVLKSHSPSDLASFGVVHGQTFCRKTSHHL